MLVQKTARSCRSRATVRRATNAQGKSRETKRTKLTVLRRVQRRWKRSAGVVGRLVEVAGRGERCATSAGRSEAEGSTMGGAQVYRRFVRDAREKVVDGCVRASQQCDREAGAPRGFVVRSLVVREGYGEGERVA